MFGFIRNWNNTRKTNLNDAKQARDDYLQNVVGNYTDLAIDNSPDLKNNLQKELERLADLVANVSISAAVAKDCNKLLDDANTLISKTTLDKCGILANFDKVKQRLMRAYDSREIKKKWFVRLFWVMVLFFLATAFLIGWFKLIPGQERLQNTAWVCLTCALWGCIGSTVDAFVAIYKHFGQQDFDEHYLPWYFVHPVLGIAIGAVVYLVLEAGLLSVGGKSLVDTSGNNTISSNITSLLSDNLTTDNLTNLINGASIKTGLTALPIALAFLGGFKQSTVMEFLTRLVNAFFPPGTNSETNA